MTHSNPDTTRGPDSRGLETARGHIARLRAALAAPTPQTIEECLPGLVEAAGCLERVQKAVAAGDRDIVFELRALERDLAGARQLIARGAAFYRGWANVLGSAAGYTPSGEATALPAAGKISVQG